MIITYQSCLLWSFHERWRLWSSLNVVDTNCTRVRTNNGISREMQSVLPSQTSIFYSCQNWFPEVTWYLIFWKWRWDLLETLSSRSQYVCNSIETFDFSTLYSTILHAQELNNWSSVVYQRRTENKRISILLLVEECLTLSIAIQNLIIIINNTRTFQSWWTTYLSCLGVECFNKRLAIQWVRNMLHYSPIISTRLWVRLPSKASQE